MCTVYLHPAAASSPDTIANVERKTGRVAIKNKFGNAVLLKPRFRLIKHTPKGAA